MNNLGRNRLRANVRLFYRYIYGKHWNYSPCSLLIFSKLIFWVQICIFSQFKKKNQLPREEMEKEIKPSKFKRICVFCGSSSGKKSSYKEAAVDLAKELVIPPSFSFSFFNPRFVYCPFLIYLCEFISIYKIFIHALNLTTTSNLFIYAILLIFPYDIYILCCYCYSI